MTRRPSFVPNPVWSIVLIIVGALLLAGLLNVRGMPLWTQFATIGILIIVAAVVWWVWRRSTRR
ncbi:MULTISPECIES: FeoB-associated Cys-rich membrane protein [Brevibacterium]|uniref:FeoB-associated Cys-rich membrane protein n=1 Tax=Brevibacterium gallinarum TaxID=2762220 RepID=A0ABR8WRI2_9MICO|nr:MULTISPECIES: FeoB-associated Cys-rich membrane protein [Brevibacterium]MBD8019673.1 FeoB-associated Cys-rich membrane protein [Brevibacterium gallinarum]MCT1872423.1 FeoB-associated Cys-rich membrane protein [Brevibacterium luteolum]MCT1890163.1 FeoB-associated Cys-rich membrane protein [Brevibacterium luteolum]MCT1892683.1 FeoB-associated Cys-rich membrane protein [Brevibacterium luteolum]MCT1920521.1 FeoB-associated Cys-rich membrane protein [Brevibacterium luteolum]